jgi:hypothetical protein
MCESLDACCCKRVNMVESMSFVVPARVASVGSEHWFQPYFVFECLENKSLMISV